MPATSDVVIVGGGPGGYESALVAAQLGARVTLVDSDGLGGSAVLTDCVPSKTLIATAELMTDVAGGGRGGRPGEGGAARGAGGRVGEAQGAGDPGRPTSVSVDLPRLNDRVKKLAAEQSADIGSRLDKEGVEVVV